MDGGRFVLEGMTYAVFDPLGGEGGDRAATLASEAFRRTINEAKTDLPAALVAGNVAIRQAALRDPSLNGAGCTAAALSVDRAAANIAWVGDVRVMRLRADNMAVLTREHSLVNDYLSRGLIAPDDKKARAALPSNVIVRALGMHAVLDVDCATEAVETDDVFVLASDSVCHALGDGLLASTIIANRSDAQAGVRALLGHAAANAARDALTVVMVVVGPRGPVAAVLSKG